MAVDQGRDLTVSIPSAATLAAIDATDLEGVVDPLVVAKSPSGGMLAVVTLGIAEGDHRIHKD